MSYTKYYIESRSGRFHSNSSHTGKYGILDGVLILFAAVVLLLKAGVGIPRNLAFSLVMDEFIYDSIAASLVKKPSESRDIRSRKHPCITNGCTQHFRKCMYPLAALLALVETCRMIDLKGIVLQIDKSEELPFGQPWKADCWIGLCENAFLATLLPLTSCPRTHVLVMGFPLLGDAKVFIQPQVVEKI